MQQIILKLKKAILEQQEVLKLKFENNETTEKLLIALSRQELKGNGPWKDTEEIDLRNISKWLRENSSKYLNKFIIENYNTEITPIKDAIRVATHYLMIFL